MSETVERRLRDVAGDFPRPDPTVTRRVERRLRARLKPSRPRRRIAASGATVLTALAVGAALGAGAVTMAAGAATERVTLAVRPTLVGDAGATLFGSVSNQRAGEAIVIESRDCGQSAYRVVSGTTTREGGAYSHDLWFSIGTVVRARWKDTVSEEVEVKRRASVGLRQFGAVRFQMWVGGVRYFEGKRARIERWDRQEGRWIAIRRVTLKRFATGAARVFSGTGTDFRLKVGRGVLLRAVFPTAQAGPCYVGGVSRILTTR